MPNYILQGLLCCFLCVSASRAQQPLDSPVPRAEKLLQKQKYEDALKALQQVSPADPSIAKALYLRGQAQFKLGRIEDAISTLEGLVVGQPAAEVVPHTLLTLAELYKKKSNPAKAAELTSTLIKKFPTHAVSVKIRTEESKPLLQAGRFAEYINSLAPIANNVDPDCKRNLRFAKLMVSKTVTPEILCEEAKRAFEADDVLMATLLYEYAAARFSATTSAEEIKTRLGWCYFTRAGEGDLKKAESLWQQVVASSKRNEWTAESQWHLVQYFAGVKNDLKSATELCSRIAKEYPKTFRAEQALFMRAWLFWASDQNELALHAFNDLTNAYPEKLNDQPIVEYINDCTSKLSDEKSRSN